MSGQGMMYQQAFQSGTQAYLAYASDGEGPASRAIYNEAYARTARSLSLQRSKNATERNIAATRQDTVLSNLAIQKRQQAAKAHAQMSAAVAGVKGGSFESVLYQTEVNAANAAASKTREEEQGIEAYLSQINSAHAQLLTETMEEPKRDTTTALLEAFSSLTTKDYQMLGNGAKSWITGSQTQPEGKQDYIDYSNAPLQQPGG